MRLSVGRAMGVAVVVLTLASTGASARPAASEVAQPAGVRVQEYRLPDVTIDILRDEWLDQLYERNAPGTWAEMKFELDDRHLALMGLPPADVLRSRSYERPTMVSVDGTAEPVIVPPAATVAGAGYFGIRPGALLLVIDDDSIGWCTLAHVYGSPGSYDISTAGHCGGVGATATAIAGFGNRAGVLNPILLDFGTFVTSTDGGIGNDHAMINIRAAYQNLVTPTMAFWGGPRGVFTLNGSVADVRFPDDLIPRVTIDPDPFLAQTIVHYGHGAGVGAGGTPRAGSAVHWGASHFMFFGAITLGDSGSGANTLLGDSVGSSMEAAGIITHLYLDPLLRRGTGLMAGTRPVVFARAPARGQLVSPPVPTRVVP